MEHVIGGERTGLPGRRPFALSVVERSRRGTNFIFFHHKSKGEDLWYKNAVIYNLDVGTFMDGDGDGHGDFEGLVRRLDYLAGLGVTCLWLLPFQPTPDRDNGYDITNYYGVNPQHGSLGDFVEFMHQARGRGIRVLMDLVVNHTSDQHPWFKAARSDKRSPYREWYLWSKKRPKNFRQGMVFPGVQETTWPGYSEAATKGKLTRGFGFLQVRFRPFNTWSEGNLFRFSS